MRSAIGYDHHNKVKQIFNQLDDPKTSCERKECSNKANRILFGDGDAKEFLCFQHYKNHFIERMKLPYRDAEHSDVKIKDFFYNRSFEIFDAILQDAISLIKKGEISSNGQPIQICFKTFGPLQFDTAYITFFNERYGVLYYYYTEKGTFGMTLLDAMLKLANSWCDSFVYYRGGKGDIRCDKSNYIYKDVTEARIFRFKYNWGKTKHEHEQDEKIVKTLSYIISPASFLSVSESGVVKINGINEVV